MMLRIILIFSYTILNLKKEMVTMIVIHQLIVIKEMILLGTVFTDMN